jgi:crotonobetainyl-CoA:carnitine CoA-transferase CaiB-like acyl-CoA transferase
LVEEVRVVDLAGQPAAAAGRVLADLGADVVLVERPEGVALRALPQFGHLDGIFVQCRSQ